MTGSYDNSTTSLFSQNSKTYDWCRGSLRTQVHLYSVTRNHLSRDGGKILRGKTGVIAYYQPPVG